MMMLKFCFCFFLEEEAEETAFVVLVDLVDFFGAPGAFADGGDEGGVLKFASEDGSPNAVAIIALATGS